MGRSEYLYLVFQHSIADDIAAAIGDGAQAGDKVIARRSAFGKLGKAGGVSLDQPSIFERGVRIGLAGDLFI